MYHEKCCQTCSILELSTKTVLSFFPYLYFPVKRLLGNFIDNGGKEFKPNNSEMAKKWTVGTNIGLQNNTSPFIKP